MEYEQEAVALCNEALVEIGQKVFINRLVASGGAKLTPNEALCALKYANARRVVLRGYDWNFARREIHAESERVDGGVQGFRFRVDVPADCLRVLAVDGCNLVRGGGAFKVQGHDLYTRTPVRHVAYSADVEDLTQWDDEARRVLVFRLAADLSIPITGISDLRQMMEQLYQTALADARNSDARETKMDEAQVDNPIAWAITH